MSRIGDLLRQLAIAYDDMELDIQNRFNYVEEKQKTQDNKMNKIRLGLLSLASSLKDEED